MSEQAMVTPSSAPAAPASPVTELAPNAVIHAPDTPAPPVAPQTPEIPTDYRINTLENGQQEVTLNSGQVYRGTSEQVINELAKAQYHASRRITELSGQIPPPPPAPIDPGPQIDPTAKALADLTAQGMGFRNAEEYMGQLQRVQAFTEQQQINQLASTFMTTTPDFYPSPENGDLVDRTLAEAGMEANLQNLKIVHAFLKSEGRYVAPPANQQVQRSPAMPMPPNGYQIQPQGPPTEEQIWAMSKQEFDAYEQRLRYR